MSKKRSKNTTTKKKKTAKKKRAKKRAKKVITIKVCREEVEVDLNNLDPKLRTHCMICGEDLTPPWWREQGKQVNIADDAVGAACSYCATVYTKTADKIKAEKREARRAKRKKPVGRMTKKRREVVEKRSKQLNKRPCGCGARGRHRRECPENKK